MTVRVEVDWLMPPPMPPPIVEDVDEKELKLPMPPPPIMPSNMLSKPPPKPAMREPELLWEPGNMSPPKKSANGSRPPKKELKSSKGSTPKPPEDP
eukprot:CAMPEP_0198240878 /NCGR_PEP_ID=MMETSP1446-20131203/5870_1 /TAXON_ID=1461542 ORGANISM="Unidentified sp, Strain CCMP2111" /NCGR_SAMPLE_ID=MMETSP1446 /ASSEMBLY_ACC=CAM_ASM_001112 /LENGTH=95 /DNA_ID=CAMNT_0043923661 /DNA_START=360 /DNA_END=647 /DNA_ORIENTATION=-